MNETTFTALEYEKLCELLSRYAQTPMGKARLENLTPLTSRLELEKDLKAISETILLNEEKQLFLNFIHTFHFLL